MPTGYYAVGNLYIISFIIILDSELNVRAFGFTEMFVFFFFYSTENFFFFFFWRQWMAFHKFLTAHLCI